MSPNRYFPLSVYFRQRFGRTVRKVPLDAGSSCPNRDGTLSRSGCSFCNARGSGTGLGREGLSLREQYLLQRDRILARGRQTGLLAYLQSFSNTHGPAARLTRLIEELDGLPDLVGLAVGTRPDCLNEKKLGILRMAPGEEIWLDLGLQSAQDRTLRRINRGHDAACFAIWATRAAQHGIKVCAHVITGLPDETMADFGQTIAFVNNLPVAGVKIHNLYVCRDTPLERDWRAGRFTPRSMDESLDWLMHGLGLLRQDIVIHRLNGDPDPGELAAPAWAARKTEFLDAARKRLRETDNWQGKALGLPLPDWFNLSAREEKS